MSIVRTERTHNYTVIPNDIINDCELGCDALGLLVYLLSKPSDYWIKVSALESARRFGSHDRIVRLLKQLRALGYATLRRFPTGHTEWVITDTRKAKTEQNEPHSENPDPHSENPNAENPNAENPNVLQSKDFYKVPIETKNTPLPPKGAVVDLKVLTNPIELPACIPKQSWDDWCRYRRERKKPITESAARLQIKSLAKWAEAGHDPTAIIETSIMNGWQGLFEPKVLAPQPAQPKVVRRAREYV